MMRALRTPGLLRASPVLSLVMLRRLRLWLCRLVEVAIDQRTPLRDDDVPLSLDPPLQLRPDQLARGPEALELERSRALSKISPGGSGASAHARRRR